jgi:hypothetical protein
MPITIAGSGTITGISAGGLPDDSIVTADIANGAVTQAKRSEQLTLGTAQASTSGTSIDFTSIPSWVKRVTVMLNGVSTNGSSNLLLQIGAGSVTTSGYLSGSSYIQGGSVGSSTSTAGFIIYNDSAVTSTYGQACIATSGSNAWTNSGVMFKATAGTNYVLYSSGGITLSGTLDRIRITTVNGTDTFDAGSINILYE